MNVTIVGGGNIGTLIAAQLSKKHNVTVFTNKVDLWSKSIVVVDDDDQTELTYHIDCVTSSLQEAFAKAQLIIYTIPAFAIKDAIKLHETYINPKTMICFYPGTGGVEFCCDSLLKKECIIFGTQRVCSVARLLEYGKKVKTSGKRSEMFIGTLSQENGEYLRGLFEEMFSIKTYLLPNYLSVTFTPSNPILHTSRLYSLFKNYENGTLLDSIPLFYQHWDDDTSKVLVKSDAELQNICSKLDKIDLTGVRSLLIHYESEDFKALTKKITSINSFKGLMTPSKRIGEKWIPDFESRYFTADFPYGLVIIKAFALILEVETPQIDLMIKWYQTYINKQYIDFDLNRLGRDSIELNTPQSIGIHKKEDIVNFYCSPNCHII